MGSIFLGKPVHWAMLVVIVGLGWWLGEIRLHVTWFNLFVVLLLAASAAVVALVLWTTRSDEQVTRDPLEPDEG